MKYEYKIELSLQEIHLNEFGQQGWELVSVFKGNPHTEYYFKRMIPIVADGKWEFIPMPDSNRFYPNEFEVKTK